MKRIVLVMGLLALVMAGCGGDKISVTYPTREVRQVVNSAWVDVEKSFDLVFERTNQAREAMAVNDVAAAQKLAADACSCAASWREQIEKGYVLLVPGDALRQARNIENDACKVHDWTLGLTR